MIADLQDAAFAPSSSAIADDTLSATASLEGRERCRFGPRIKG
jgi:hypothetical protein